AGAVSAAAPTTFEASAQLLAQEGRHIPMFGVKECKNVAWSSFSLTWLGRLWLLRSVAKIEVMAAEGAPALKSVALTGINKLGTCAPKGVYAESDYVIDDANYKPADGLTLPGGKNDPMSGEYLLQADDNGVYSVYVPEYQILEDFANPRQTVSDHARLKVRFEGLGSEYFVDFKYYTEESAEDNEASVGDYFDIKRNYIYRYTLSVRDADPEVEVEVLPYRAVTLKPDFGLKLPDVTLNKYVVYLYCNEDPNKLTASQDKVVAYNENGRKYTASEVEWELEAGEGNYVCTIETDANGDCIVKTNGKRGRDVLTATIKDKNGLEVTAECVVEVTYRHLGLDKTFLGLTPKGVNESSNSSSFNAFLVAESSATDMLEWELLELNDETPSDLDVRVEVFADGALIENGGTIGPKRVDVKVYSGEKTGSAHLWLHYWAPDPSDATKKVKYSSYCEILVEPISLTCYPKKATVTVGQSTSVSNRITPRFSDFLPAVKYEVSNPEVLSVDEHGLITGLTPGTATVTAYNDTDFSETIYDTVEVTVEADHLVLKRTDYGIVASHIELLSGETVTLRAYSGEKNVTSKVKWSIVENDNASQKNFISCTGGKVKALEKSGTCTLMASYEAGGETYTSTCIFVTATKRELRITGHPAVVSVEAQVPLSAYVFPDKRPEGQRELNVTWKSKNKKIISIISENGVYYANALSTGMATITASATYEGSPLDEATCKIKVAGMNEEAEKYDGSYTLSASTTPDGNYTHDDIVGGKMSWVNIPYQKTYRVDIAMDKEAQSVEWKIERRYTWYDQRISIANIPGTKSFTITSTQSDDVETRYNEVVVTITYTNGQTDKRRFAVFCSTKKK
ncbi:MAG: Ig-like domain-containing protein, partial [Lachnospiraceae bacterium]|nr:Ig-like domain-containing protein [Lachnospiraceae bacterium]